MHIFLRHSFSRVVVLFSPFIVFFILFLSFQTPAYAASLYLSPGSKNVYQGTNFSVSVRMNSGGEAVNAAQANLSYPADKLDFIGIGSGGSAFSIAAPSGGGSGGVSISRGVIGSGVSGDKLVATVTFRPKGGAAGVATVSFSGGSALVRGTDQANILSGTTGGNYNIGPASSAPVDSTSTQTTSASPSSPLRITNVKVTNLSFRTATVEWVSDRPSSSIVEYGINTKYGLISQDTNKTTAHKVTLFSELLLPGTKYYYRVKSVDEAEQEAVSPNGTFFITQGIRLSVKVEDTSGIALSKRLVTLVTPQGPREETTNERGIAEFKDVPPTTHTVIVKENGTETAMIVNVNMPTEKEMQERTVKPHEVTVKVARGKAYSFSSVFLALVILILAIIVSIIFFLKKRRKVEA